MRRWFLPESPDLLALLRHQGEITLGGFNAFSAWAAGDGSQGRVVRDAEHDADKVRRELQLGLRRTFNPPLDAEDLYELSERLDEVLNAAKNTVRESEITGIEPDRPMAAMASAALEAVGHLVAAFEALVSDPDRATEEADAAIRAERRLEHTYRVATSALLDVESLRELVGRRDLYRHHTHLGERIVRVAERIWYAVVKEG